MTKKKGDRPLWFKAKRYGWGWTPYTWQGWLVTIMFVLAVAITAYLYRLLPLTEAEFAAVYIPTVVAHALVLIGVCAYTGETPRWRWGDD